MITLLQNSKIILKFSLLLSLLLTVKLATSQCTLKVKDTVVCSGSCVTLHAQGANTYEWAPATSLNTITGSSVIACPVVTTIYTVTGTDSQQNTCTAKITVQVYALPILVVSPNKLAICLGKSTNLMVSGGITYKWSPSEGLNSTSGSIVTANPTVTTTYTVTGTDKYGCSNTATAVVTVNPLPIIKLSQTINPICSGECTTLTATGAYWYSWEPVTGLNPTTGSTVIACPLVTTIYTVSGTDLNGCVNTAQTTLKVNPLPSIAVTPKNGKICIGDNIILTATGGITYLWSPSDGLSATTGAVVTAYPTVTTTYTVTGTDLNGCSNTTTAVVTVNPLPNVTLTQTNYSICNGECVKLEVNGAITYSWSPMTGLSTSNGYMLACPTSNITYTVIGSDANGCTNTAKADFKVYPLPDIKIIPADTTICPGTSVTLIASGAYYYKWDFGVDMPYLIVNPISTTTYTVTGTDTYNCKNTAVSIVRLDPAYCVGIDNLSNINSDIKIYPNPAYGLITLEAENKLNEVITIELKNTRAQSVYYQDFPAALHITETIDLSNLQKGVYFVCFKTNTQYKVKKLLLL